MRKAPMELWALRLTAEEKAMLEALADKQGMNMSQVVRLLIKRSYNGGVRK